MKMSQLQSTVLGQIDSCCFDLLSRTWSSYKGQWKLYFEPLNPERRLSQRCSLSLGHTYIYTQSMSVLDQQRPWLINK